MPMINLFAFSMSWIMWKRSLKTVNILDGLSGSERRESKVLFLDFHTGEDYGSFFKKVLCWENYTLRIVAFLCFLTLRQSLISQYQFDRIWQSVEKAVVFMQLLCIAFFCGFSVENNACLWYWEWRLMVYHEIFSHYAFGPYYHCLAWKKLFGKNYWLNHKKEH